MSARVLALVNLLMSPEEVAAAVAPMRADLDAIDRKKRTYFRKSFGAMGYVPAVLDILFPKLRAGRIAVEREADAWSSVSGPVREKLLKVFGVGELPEAADWWTSERAAEAADTVAAHYSPNVGSQVSGLARMRVALKGLGVTAEVIAATKRPEITTARNAAATLTLAEAVTKGIDFPPPFEKLADFVARVDSYLAQDPKTWEPSAQTVADWYTAFVARPGEIETFEMGPNGGVMGVLKKRGGEPKEWPIVSALGEEKARQFFRWWETVPVPKRGAARKALPGLLRQWSSRRQDARDARGLVDDGATYTTSVLRKIGADLACQARRPKNLGQTFAVMGAALRHEQPKARAVDHYARMNAVEPDEPDEAAAPEEKAAPDEKAPESEEEPDAPEPPAAPLSRSALEIVEEVIGPELFALLQVARGLDAVKLAALLQVARAMG